VKGELLVKEAKAVQILVLRGDQVARGGQTVLRRETTEAQYENC